MISARACGSTTSLVESSRMGRSDAIYQKGKQGKSGEALFFDLAIEDLRTAADLFHPIYDRTNWHRWLGFA
jgi:hypothetical protein